MGTGPLSPISLAGLYYTIPSLNPLPDFYAKLAPLRHYSQKDRDGAVLVLPAMFAWLDYIQAYYSTYSTSILYELPAVGCLGTLMSNMPFSSLALMPSALVSGRYKLRCMD